MIDVKNKKGAIVGYMGYQPNADSQQQESQQGHLQSHIPGYVGYIPGVKSENLYSKTYGKITQNCAKGQFNRGIEPPVDSKYKSTTKETYAHPNKIKGEELGEGKISGVKLSTLSNAGKWLVDSKGGNEFTPKQVTDLTYEQACQQAYK